ncbi:MAG: hypothetical protein E2O38_00620 [Proteobacteria bacterium]|nr:MAG: hypothetical protein E2O38_00620 [Pseudomonadota bacterium]
MFEPSTARADASIAIAPALDNTLGGVRSANFSVLRWISWPTNVLLTSTGLDRPHTIKGKMIELDQIPDAGSVASGADN